MVEVSFDPCADIRRPLHRGETIIEHEPGNARGCLDLDFQDVRLRRKEHPSLQLLRANLVGNGPGCFDEQFIGRPLRMRQVDRQSDGRKDIQVVGL